MSREVFIEKLLKNRIIIIGPPGGGKSRLGNYLSVGNNFATGERRGRVTTQMKIVSKQNGLMICDMPGKILKRPSGIRSSGKKLYFILRFWK